MLKDDVIKQHLLLFILLFLFSIILYFIIIFYLLWLPTRVGSRYCNLLLFTIYFTEYYLSKS